MAQIVWKGFDELAFSDDCPHIVRLPDLPPSPLPPDSQQIRFSAYALLNHDFLFDEMRAWLKDESLVGRVEVKFWEDAERGANFAFSDANVALAFKVRWA